MIWLAIILLFICSLLCWLLFSPLIIEIDSSRAFARVRWLSIGQAGIRFDEEWKAGFRILFFHRQFPLSEIKFEKKLKAGRKAQVKKKKRKIPFKKMMAVLKSFRVIVCKLAIDTGDDALNARLYPLNFLPHLHHHLRINFNDENLFQLKIRNSPWRMIYAFIR